MRPDRGRDRVSAALYRTRITHLRRAPIHHHFEHRSYSWFVDVDALPRLPWWVRPFADFQARDHLWTAPDDTLRGRVDAFLAAQGIDLGGGTVTALLHARVLGHVFNPLTLYWCHDAGGALPQARRRSAAVLGAAAAVAIGLGALGVGYAVRPAPAPTTAEQVFAAPDVRTVSGEVPGGGTATVVYSRERDAGVLVMNNVPPPEPGTVYQMWLVGAGGPSSAGTMDAAAVAPSTTAVLPDLGSFRTLAFTIEPAGGSTQPTSPAFAELPLA